MKRHTAKPFLIIVLTMTLTMLLASGCRSHRHKESLRTDTREETQSEVKAQAERTATAYRDDSTSERAVSVMLSAPDSAGRQHATEVRYLWRDRVVRDSAKSVEKEDTESLSKAESRETTKETADDRTTDRTYIVFMALAMVATAVVVLIIRLKP